MLFDLRRLRKKIIAVVAIIIILVVLAVLWKMGAPPNEADRIYTNVYIHGVDVGGMKKDEAEAALLERFQMGFDARVIQYLLNDEVAAEFTFADFGTRFNFSVLVENALEYSHKRNIISRISRVYKKHEITSPPLFIFNAEKMEEIMRQISGKLDILPQNATFTYENSGIVKHAESVGYGVNIQSAALLTKEILNSLNSGTVELELITITPLYTSEDFDFTASVLGYFETTCVSNPEEPRYKNIIIAAERINNSVVYPGEVFSAGAVIASNIPDNGYETSIILVNGKPAEDVGGGVCQVVTTLYNAVLFAELEVIQRNNHSARVTYIDLGFDATVAGDYFDLKFINNTQNPLLITCFTQNDKLYVGIHGNETRPVERDIRFEARIKDTVLSDFREIIDPSILRGQRMVLLEPQNGHTVELYKHVYLNDIEIEQVKINSSLYRPLQGVIAIGAG